VLAKDAAKPSLSFKLRHYRKFLIVGLLLIFGCGGFTFEALGVLDTCSLMKTWIAILVTSGLLAICWWIAAWTGLNVFFLLVVGTSVWAGVDSAEIHLKRYQSGISYRPVALGLLCSMFWIVAFPWYLSMRYKIRTGTAHLRPEFEPWDMGSGQISPTGLVQPWQGKKL
jgi:hypothetical protein